VSALVQAGRPAPVIDQGAPLLLIEAVRAGYGGSQILWGVDLTVARSRVVCLMGRNGVGKTTLLRAVMGLLPTRGGRIVLDGADITRWPAERRARAGIGYVPQGREIFPHLTVAENLRMALIGCGRASTLDAALDVFPRLRGLLGRKGGVLSGGEQQMLAIGRALLMGPRLLVLDEPTEGIQPSIIDEIEEAIQRIRVELGVAVLLVEQYVDFAQRLADEYVVMAKGAIVARGDPRELSADTLRQHLSI
jgi:urea transport system ATP-binding protein